MSDRGVTAGCHASGDPDRGRNACRNRRESMLNLRDSMLSRGLCALEEPEQDPRKHGTLRWLCELEVPEQDPRKHGTRRGGVGRKALRSQSGENYANRQWNYSEEQVRIGMSDRRVNAGCHAFADPDRGRNACRNRRESMLNLRDSMLSRWLCELEVPEQDPRKHGTPRRLPTAPGTAGPLHCQAAPGHGARARRARR